MLGVTSSCHITELLRALDIELTSEKYTIAKLSFLSRLLANSFTVRLYSELDSLKVENSFPMAIKKILIPVENAYHICGRPFTLQEKAQIMIDSLKTFGRNESEKYETIKLVKRILANSNMKMVPYMLYFYLNSRGANEFWYNI